MAAIHILAAKLASISRLKAGWDGDNSKPISVDALLVTKAVVSKITKELGKLSKFHKETFLDGISLIPLSYGGIMIRFNSPQIIIEIAVQPMGSIDFYISNSDDLTYIRENDTLDNIVRIITAEFDTYNLGS